MRICSATGPYDLRRRTIRRSRSVRAHGLVSQELLKSRGDSGSPEIPRCRLIGGALAHHLENSSRTHVDGARPVRHMGEGTPYLIEEKHVRPEGPLARSPRALSGRSDDSARFQHRVNTSFMMGGALGLAVLVSISTARTNTLLAGTCAANRCGWPEIGG